MAEILPVDGDGSGGSEKELTGTTEIDAEVFGDEEFKYECPNCGYQFQNNAPRMGGQKGQRGGCMMQGGQMPGNQAQPNGPMNGQQQAPRRQAHIEQEALTH